MKSKIHPTFSILQEACEKFGYSCQFIDEESQSLLEVSDNLKHFYSSYNKSIYPLNTSFSAKVANDKAWCYQVLNKKGYRIPEGEHFFVREEFKELRAKGHEFEDALSYARNKYPVFVKPNDCSSGFLAEIIYNEAQLKKHLKAISKLSLIALIQKIIRQPEYRIFAIDGKIEFVYERSAPHILGNNYNTVKELLNLNNLNLDESHQINPDSEFLKKQLKNENLNLNSILEKNHLLQIASKSNLRVGGFIQNYSEQVSGKTQKWVKQIMKDLGLRICGIDVFVEKSIDDPNSFIIIEVNASPGLAGIYELGKKEKVMEIWGKVFKKFFENEK